jgi:hypothetical protein
MPNNQANASPRVSCSDVNRIQQFTRREPPVRFEDRPEDWLASGDWLAAGERLKSRPPNYPSH